MKVTIDIYLALDAINKSVKVFTQDITEDFDRKLAETRPVYSTDGIKEVCYRVAEEFRVKWEITNQLGGRTFARTRIRMD